MPDGQSPRARRFAIAAAIASTLVAVGLVLLWTGRFGGVGTDGDRDSGASNERPPAAQASPPTLAARPAAVADRARSPQPLDSDAPAPANAADVDPSLQARIRLVDGATGRTIGDDELDGQSAGGFSSGLGSVTTAWLLVPDSAKWVPVDPSLSAREIERRTVRGRARPADAASALVVWPLYRATEIRLRVLDGAGSAVPDSRLRGWVGLGRSETVDVAAASDGVVRLTGLPFLPTEVLWLIVKASVADGDVVEGIRSSHRDTRALTAVARVVLPDAWVPTIDATLSLDASSAILDAELFDHNETDNDLPTAFATLRIRAVRHDGTPAAAAQLRVNGAAVSAEADGRVQIRVPAIGPVRVSLADASLVPTTLEVSPRPDETLDVVLDEPEPASLEVVVTFADGQPVPFARLTVSTPSGVPPWDLVDGVLRLDPFTDERGRRVYTRVEPTEVSVNAQWGSRQISTQVRLLPGRRGAARLVLPDPPADRPPGLGVEDVSELPVLPMPTER